MAPTGDEPDDSALIAWRPEVRQLGAQLAVTGPLSIEALRDWAAKLSPLPAPDRTEVAEQIVALGLNIERMKLPVASALLAQLVLLVTALMGGDEKKAQAQFEAQREKSGPDLGEDGKGEAPPQKGDDQLWK